MITLLLFAVVVTMSWGHFIAELLLCGLSDAEACTPTAPEARIYLALLIFLVTIIC
jgi:hypothetical protein